MKALVPEAAYSESTFDVFSYSAEKRQKQVSPSLDAELDSQPGLPGPVESELSTYNPGKVLGLVAGAYAELPCAFDVIIDLTTSQLADGHPQFFNTDHGTCRSIFL